MSHAIIVSPGEEEARRAMTAKSIAARWGSSALVVGASPSGSGFPRLVPRTRRSFDAAITNRLTADWTAHSRLSADAEIQGKIPILRDRSRDLERNDPYGENFLRLAENNVVGSAGIGLQMKVVLDETEDPATGELVVSFDSKSNRMIERAWKKFCRRKNFLVTRNMSATAAFKTIVRTVLRDGDCLIRKVRGYPNEFGFALQLFEADYLDDQYIDFRGVPCNCPNEFRLPDGNPYPLCQSGQHEVRMGVELQGDWKFPVAYWLLAHHPGDLFYGTSFSPKRIRVPVNEIIHPFIIKRIEQTRGIPAMVSAMLRLQMLGGYAEAELVAARAAAQKMGFLEKEVPDSVADQYYGGGTDASGQAVNDCGHPGDGCTIESAAGEIEELPMGVKFKEWDPTHPNGNFGAFNKDMLRGYGAGCGVSYTALANDIENVNFSSIRAGLLEEREVWKSLQRFLIDDVCLEIFPDWLQNAMLYGAIDLPFSRMDDFTDDEAVCFKARRWPWVDPQKDVDAAIKAIEANLDTKSNVIAEMKGGDYEDIVSERAREVKMERAAGLPALSLDLQPKIEGTKQPTPPPAV